MNRLRVYVRENYQYSREYFYQPTDEEFLEDISNFCEYAVEEGGEFEGDENFTPENILAVFKGESDLYDIHGILNAMRDRNGGYDFLGEYIEDYSDCLEETVECNEESEYWFERRRLLKE